MGEVFEHPGVRSLPGVDEHLVADANADGSPDLIALSSTQIAVHLNDGAGTFGPPVVSPVTAGYADFAGNVPTDFDLDGDIDLIRFQPGVNGQALRFELYRNDGAGSFSLQQSIPLDPGFAWVWVPVAPADFNGDGRPDLLYTEDNADRTARTHRIRLGTPTGFDGALWTVPALPDGTAKQVAVFDQNQDGNFDLLLDPESDLVLYTLLGSPAGLGAPISSPIDATGGWSLGPPFFGDFDLDGVTDCFLVMGEVNPERRIGLCYGRADGSFEPPIDVPGSQGETRLRIAPDPSAPPSAPAFYIALDSDVAGRHLHRLELDQSGSPVVTPLSKPGGNPLRDSVIAIADYDGDGAGDLLTLEAQVGMHLYLVKGDALVEENSFPRFGFAERTEDLNADGLPDIAWRSGVTPSGGQLLRLALTDGVSGFDLDTRIDEVYFVAERGAFADLNADGIPDLVGSAPIPPGGNHAPIAYAIGNPDGTHAPTQLIQASRSASRTRAGDLTGDGVVDLFCQGPNSTLSMFPGNGDGTFGAEQFLNLPNTQVALTDNPRYAAGDLDGDGWDDIVVSLAGGSNRGWVFWHHQGTGTFGSFTQFTGVRPSAPRIADLDGDGLAELLLGSEAVAQADRGKVLWNMGSRSFDTEPLASFHTRVVPVSDLDGDGIRDVVGLQPFAVYESGGTPSFGAPAVVLQGAGVEQDLIELNNATDATSADLDQDGDMDLVLAVEGGAVVRNRGNGLYELDGIYVEGNVYDEAALVRTEDLDQDGMPDAALVYPRTVSVRLNQCSPPAPCPADLAPPAGVLDLADISVFVGGFTTGDPIADLNPDGVFDLADITAFVASFTAGCP